MITGVHMIVFSPEAEKVRAFFTDVLGLPSVDAGGGRAIITSAGKAAAALGGKAGTRIEPRRFAPRSLAQFF